MYSYLDGRWVHSNLGFLIENPPPTPSYFVGEYVKVQKDGWLYPRCRIMRIDWLEKVDTNNLLYLVEHHSHSFLANENEVLGRTI